MFYIYVNGNLVHDEKGDGSHAPLTFASKIEGDAAADALFAQHVVGIERTGIRLDRSMYVVAEEPPTSA